MVLLELVQPRLDGLSVLRRLAEAESAPSTVTVEAAYAAAELEGTVTEILREISVPVHFKGYPHLREGDTLQDPGCGNCNTDNKRPLPDRHEAGF